MSTLQRIHSAFTSLVMIVAIISTCVYVYESEFVDFDDLVQYFYVLPAKDVYASHEELKYYSFVTSEGVSKIEWNERLYCDFDGSWLLKDTDNSTLFDWSSDQFYTTDIENILEHISIEGNFKSTPEERAQLRQYAQAEKSINGWVLNIARPMKAGTQCYSTHTVKAYTHFFGLEKKRRMQSVKVTFTQ